MEMHEIYASLQAKLNEIEPKYLEAEKDYEFHMAEAEKASKRMDEVKSSVDALRKAIAALGEGNFSYLVDDKPKKPIPIVRTVGVPIVTMDTTAPLENATVSKSPRERAGKWKNLEVWQYKPNGEVMNNWTSQRMAAKALGWSQSGLSHFMKYSKEKQIRERGYYIEWVG